MKFGGTSLGSADRIKDAAHVVASSCESDPIVVLSAMGGVTDLLLDAGEKAIRGADPEVAETLTTLRTKHESVVSVLIEDAGKAADLLSDLEPLWEEMQKVLTGVLLLRELSTRSRDLVGSFGERLIVPIFAAYLNQIDVQAEAVDARRLIVTKDEADFALVDFDETKLRCREVVEIVGRGVVPILTGFICATPEGITTTLGRGGSDYSASVVGYSVNADEIQIWTDVDGVMTADPRIVSSARVLRQISYKEAAEMSYFGAKVLHPKTIMPAADLGIPIHIKNTFDPKQEGTLITTESPKIHQGVKTVSSITGVTLVSIEGRGMIGVPGTAQKGLRCYRKPPHQRIDVFTGLLRTAHFSRRQQAGRRQYRACVGGGSSSRKSKKRQVDRIADISDIAIIALVGRGHEVDPGYRGQNVRRDRRHGDEHSHDRPGIIGVEPVSRCCPVDAPTAVRLIHDAFELGDV